MTNKFINKRYKTSDFEVTDLKHDWSEQKIALHDGQPFLELFGGCGEDVYRVLLDIEDIEQALEWNDGYFNPILSTEDGVHELRVERTDNDKVFKVYEKNVDVSVYGRQRFKDVEPQVQYFVVVDNSEQNTIYERRPESIEELTGSDENV